MSSSTATPKKPPLPPPGSAGSARRPATRGLSGTPISARAAVKKSISTSSPITINSPSGDDEGAQNDLSRLMMQLQEKLEQAELSLQDMKRHNEALQARFDDATKDQAEMEEKLHEEEERREELENEKREIVKQKRELENIYEAERAAVMKDKDATNSREEELQNIIQRLKESLSQRDVSRGGLDADASRNGVHTNSSSPILDPNQFAPGLNRSNSFRNNSKLLLQKDKVIEELRLELAEYQIKLMELDNKDGDRTHGLEKALMEARVTNARLMEENESFQSLLMEKTLNGEFTQKRISDHSTIPSNVSVGGTTLADELAEISDEDPEPDADKMRRLEIEIERQKAENRTLTLYINKIIERILKHKGGFENILNTADDEDVSAPGSSAGLGRNKDLPLPPPKDVSKEQSEAEPQGFLQRARSIAYGAGRRPRPQSVMAPPRSTPSVNEHPDTAPRIPLGRNQQQRHSMALPRRTQTSAEYMSGAAAVVSHMYKGDPDGANKTISPGMGSPRASYFLNRVPSGPRTATTSQTLSEAERRMSSSAASEEDSEAARKRALDALTGDASETSIDHPSPPRSVGGKDDTRQVISGKQMRPLRLVNEEQKKNNRASWLPNTVSSTVSNWFNKDAAAVGGAQQAQAPANNALATPNS